MNKIDRRHTYVLMVDTETANTQVTLDGKLCMDYVLPYDIGWSIVDTKGRVYRSRSYVVKDIFYGEADLMKSAYYAKKLGQYHLDIAQGKRIPATAYTIWKQMREDMQEFDCNIVCAQNTRFDYRALNNLRRWTTKSKHRYWFPYGTIFWDTMRMARDVIHQMPTYKKWCDTYNLKTAQGKLSTTAEALYSFIIKDPDFEEAHTALEDVTIETVIMTYCFRQHKKMRKEAWGRAIKRPCFS